MLTSILYIYSECGHKIKQNTVFNLISTLWAEGFQNFLENLWQNMYLPNKDTLTKRLAKDFFDDIYVIFSGPSCSKLTMLINNSLKFTISVTRIC